MRTHITRASLFVALSAAVLLPTSGRADDAATRKALEKQYAKIDQAFKTKNIKPLQEVTTPDYTLTPPDSMSGMGGAGAGQPAPKRQVITRQQMEAQFSTAVSFIQTVTNASTKINKVSVKGGSATVDAVETVNGIVADPQTQGKTHTMDLVNQYQDTWVKSGSMWLRKHSDLVKATVVTDGHKQDLGAVLGGGGTRR